jgi:hypothetical protein
MMLSLVRKGEVQAFLIRAKHGYEKMVLKIPPAKCVETPGL